MLTRRDLDRLYRRHGRRLFGLGWQLTGSAAEAEDAVQETFLRALRSRESYRESGRARSWLDRILVNVVRERRRRQSQFRDRIRPVLERQSPEEADPSPDPLRRAALDQELERLRSALEELPRTFREVLVLRHFEDRTTAEVAAVLEIPEGTVRSRLKRAREMLIAAGRES